MSDHGPGQTTQPARRVWLALALVLLAGFALRCWYLSYDLSYQRFWDERYSFVNVRGILDTGSLKPAKAYYPSPLVSWPQAGLVAASEALHEATGWPFLDADRNGRFLPPAFFSVRMLSAVYGAAGLLMTFLVGRLMFSTPAALLGTVVLTFLPWHIHASAKFKPDALLVFTVLLAFYGSIRAVRQERLRPYVWTGVAIALAVSSKLTGVIVALPLIVATAFLVKDDRRRLRWLFAAGLSSLVAFFALNPYGLAYVRFVRGLQRDYAMRAEAAGMTRGSMAEVFFDYLTGPLVHGPWLGALALIGFAALALSLIRDSPPGRRAERMMFLSFPIAYAAAYTLATPYFKGNNFLPLLPFSSLLVGWVLHTAWRRLKSRLPPRAHRQLAVVGIAVVSVAAAWLGWTYVYRSLVPTTWDGAIWQFERYLGPSWGRALHSEPFPQPQPRWEGSHEFGEGVGLSFVSERLDDFSMAQLSNGDGEIFLHSRLGGEAADFYHKRIEGSRGWHVVIEPRWFRFRGPAVVVAPRLRQLVGLARADGATRCGVGCRQLEWPDQAAGTQGLVSVSVSFQSPPEARQLRLRYGERSVELFMLGPGKFRYNVASRRFRWAGEPMQLETPNGEPLAEVGFEARLHSWSGRLPWRRPES